MSAPHIPHTPINMLPLTKKPPITKQNLCIFFFVIGGVECTIKTIHMARLFMHTFTAQRCTCVKFEVSSTNISSIIHINVTINETNVLPNYMIAMNKEYMYTCISHYSIGV